MNAGIHTREVEFGLLRALARDVTCDDGLISKFISRQVFELSGCELTNKEKMRELHSCSRALNWDRFYRYQVKYVVSGELDWPAADAAEEPRHPFAPRPLYL